MIDVRNVQIVANTESYGRLRDAAPAIADTPCTRRTAAPRMGPRARRILGPGVDGGRCPTLDDPRASRAPVALHRTVRDKRDRPPRWLDRAGLDHLPIASAVGLTLGLTSAACARVTKVWAPRHRRGRWVRYLGSLIAAYAVVVAAVHVLAPTATQPVTLYAFGAALLAVGSCFLLAWFERRRDRAPAPI